MRRESGLRPPGISPRQGAAPCSPALRREGVFQRHRDQRLRTESPAARAIRAGSARWRRGQAASASALLGYEPLLPRDRVRVLRLRILLQAGEQIALLIALFLASGLSVVALFSLAGFPISRGGLPSTGTRR